MPEGPAILHLRNQLKEFIGKKVKNAGGYGTMPTKWIEGKKLKDIITWGKHLLFIFKDGTVKIHLGLFGQILINERRKANRKFYLEFANGEINGYVVRATKLEKNLKEIYDWRTDILSPSFSEKHVKELLKSQSEKEIGDVLMNQDIFSGVGNKIRNESLYLAGIHPLSITGKIPSAKITQLIKAVKKYAKQFYNELEKTGEHTTFNVYKLDHASDGSEVTMKILHKSKRKIYFSEHKQKLYK